MNELRQKASALLGEGTVQVVIGYAPGSAPGQARPLFARTAEAAEQLIFDERCQQNLAVYLLKPEVKALGRAALAARESALRTVLQLGAETQLADSQLLVLAVTTEGKVIELGDMAAIEAHVAALPQGLSAQEEATLDELEKLPREKRWEYWMEQFTRCMKCYACRAACPLCYCERCVVEANQPQWVCVPPHQLGNMEWHVVRAMHLAGRCINCGNCARACPVGIRLDLLSQALSRELAQNFGAWPGTSAKQEYALSAYKPEDKEDFIR